MSEEAPKVEPQVEAPVDPPIEAPVEAPKEVPVEEPKAEQPVIEVPPAEAEKVDVAPEEAPKAEVIPPAEETKAEVIPQLSEMPKHEANKSSDPVYSSNPVPQVKPLAPASTSRGSILDSKRKISPTMSASKSMFGHNTMALLRDENLTVAEREQLAIAKRNERLAKKRIVELEEEQRAFLEEKKEQESIAKKEKILELSRSRSRDRSATKPNALNQPTKVEIKNYKPASPKQTVKPQSPKQPDMIEAVNQGYYKPQFENGQLNTYLKSEGIEVNTAPLQPAIISQKVELQQTPQQVAQESFQVPQQTMQDPASVNQNQQMQSQQYLMDVPQQQLQASDEVMNFEPYVPQMLNQGSEVYLQDNLEGTFKPNEIEQNRQKVLSDNLLSKFQNDQDNFKTRDLKQIEADFNNHFVRLYQKGSHASGVQQCKLLIQDHQESQDVATVFLRTLLDKNIVNMAVQSGPASVPFLIEHIKMIGFLAENFRFNMVETLKDKDPSVAKTTKRIVAAMKEMFFSQSHDQIRSELAECLSTILEKCFVNKRYGYENKKAKDLIFQPLFDELQSPKERISRQTTCIVLKKLNEKYMQDPDMVNILHSHTFAALGIKNKIYDGEFLMAIVDLLNEHGIAISIGECLIKTVNHFLASIKYNLTGQNAGSKMHRDQHICASITALTVFANCCVDTEYAIQVIPKYLLPLQESLQQLQGESQPILRLRQQCQMAWKKLDLHVQTQQQLVQENQLSQMNTQTQQFEQQYAQNDYFQHSPTPDFASYTQQQPDQMEQQQQQQQQQQQPELLPQFQPSSSMNIQQEQYLQQQHSPQFAEQQQPNPQLTNQLNDIQSNIEKSLTMIQKKMNNIEQKVFATQKNMDAIEKTPEPMVLPKKSQEQETLKMMLETLQKQQEQINTFMKNTQVDLKSMETQIVHQNSMASKLQEKNVPSTPQMINDVAQALYDKQQEEKLKESILKLDRKLEVSAEKENQSNNQFFSVRNQGQRGATTAQRKPQQELTYVEKKVLKTEKMSAIWLTMSKLAVEQDYQSAYEMALTQSDDIYLLRLIVQTGPVLTKGLTDGTAKKVLQRLNRIVRGGIFYKIQIDWLDEARKGEVFRNLNHQEQNEYLDTLFQFANPNSDLVKPELKDRAAEVYRIAKNQARNGY